MSSPILVRGTKLMKNFFIEKEEKGENNFLAQTREQLFFYITAEEILEDFFFILGSFPSSLFPFFSAEERKKDVLQTNTAAAKERARRSRVARIQGKNFTSRSHFSKPAWVCKSRIPKWRFLPSRSGARAGQSY